VRYILALLCLFCFAFCNAEIKVFYADGSKDSKKVALTFDDGPGKATERILEILKEKDVKATFFMLGRRAAENPAAAKKAAQEGHEIASHTYDHFNFYKYTEEDKNEKIESELLKSEKAIKKATGVKPYLVRYPYGYARQDAQDTAKKHKYFVINWSFGCDWDLKLTEEEMYEKYAGAIKSGAIFIMHDSSTKAVNILAGFIDKIKAEGYEIVTVSELLELQVKYKK